MSSILNIAVQTERFTLGLADLERLDEQLREADHPLLDHAKKVTVYRQALAGTKATSKIIIVMVEYHEDYPHEHPLGTTVIRTVKLIEPIQRNMERFFILEDHVRFHTSTQTHTVHFVGDHTPVNQWCFVREVAQYTTNMQRKLLTVYHINPKALELITTDIRRVSYLTILTKMVAMEKARERAAMGVQLTFDELVGGSVFVLDTVVDDEPRRLVFTKKPQEGEVAIKSVIKRFIPPSPTTDYYEFN